MNTHLKCFAKDFLNVHLAKCTEDQQIMFKKMYGKGNLEKNIMDIVEDMPSDKLDRAMIQVEQTLIKNDIELSEYEWE